MARQILVAKRSAVFHYRGKRVIIRQGSTHVYADDPIATSRPNLFEPITVTEFVTQASERPAEDVVEEATSEPGQRRRRGRPPLPRDENGNIVRDKAT